MNRNESLAASIEPLGFPRRSLFSPCNFTANERTSAHETGRSRRDPVLRVARLPK